MNTFSLKKQYALALALAGTLLIAPAMAKKPSSDGHGKGDRSEHSEGKSDRNERSERRDHFEDRHRVAVREYYDGRYRDGRCPPGLAKKHNGCMPPGQAKKWHVGQHLPREVVYYTVPQQLVLQIGSPPSGYRYVRVDSDILLMAIGTRMIVDSIQNLGRS